MVFMQIRLATKEDAQNISELIHRVSHFFTLRSNGEGAEAFFDTISVTALEQTISADHFMYWVGVNPSNKVIGAIALRDHRHLYHLFVTPEEQGKGFATQLWQHLLAHVLAHASRHGNPTELTVNSSLVAQNIYRGFGFEISDEVQYKHGLAYIPMRLNLSSHMTKNELAQGN